MTADKSLPSRFERIAVIGAGLAGRSFSRHLLQHGYPVTLEDVLPSNLRRLAAELDSFGVEVGSNQLELVATVEDAVRSADLVVDFVPDELESKLEILSMIDRMAPPRTIVLTPTDVLSISDLASCSYRPERCFGLAGLGRQQAFTDAANLTLLHPSNADPAVLGSVEEFLRSLHLSFSRKLDPHPSLLAGR